MDRIKWWQWLPFRGWRVVAVVDSADNIPKRLPRNGVVIVGQVEKPKWVAFDCPCRSGHRILLNTDKTRRPYWSLRTSDKLSIHPSIDFENKDRRCHYFVRNGKINWAHGRVST
jgi:hypothetical protein